MAIALWRLSTGNSFRSTAAVFGVGKSSAVQITKEFCVIMSQSARHYIKMPNNERETAIALENFSEHCELPQVIGAIDGTHIEIIAPEFNPTDYFSRKQKYTVNAQAVVGAGEVFSDVAAGFPGSIHDAKVLRASKLFRKAENNEILTRPVIHLSNPPLKSWLIKPYPYNGVLTRSQKKYNRTLSSARSIVERAFGLLKRRWRCLLKRLDNKICNVAETIITCCVLHNICQENCDAMVDEEFLAVVLQRERDENTYVNEADIEATGENVRRLIENCVNYETF